MFRFRIVYKRPVRRVRRRIVRRRAATAASKRGFQEHKEAARAVVHSKILQWNAHYKCPIKKVFIKNSTSRWGSCSTLGNLNFNYRLLFLPEGLQDYVVVHELCHLRELNHSPAFWALVSQAVPDYKAKRAALRRVHMR